jgi:hypothetical protein
LSSALTGGLFSTRIITGDEVQWWQLSSPGYLLHPSEPVFNGSGKINAIADQVCGLIKGSGGEMIK